MDFHGLITSGAAPEEASFSTSVMSEGALMSSSRGDCRSSGLERWSAVAMSFGLRLRMDEMVASVRSWRVPRLRQPRRHQHSSVVQARRVFCARWEAPAHVSEERELRALVVSGGEDSVALLGVGVENSGSRCEGRFGPLSSHVR